MEEEPFLVTAIASGVDTGTQSVEKNNWRAIHEPVANDATAGQVGKEIERSEVSPPISAVTAGRAPSSRPGCPP